MSDRQAHVPGNPLTGAQQLILLGQRLHPDAPLYNMALAFDIRGALERMHFENAYRALLERSDAFRAVVFVSSDDVPRTRDGGIPGSPVEHIDLSDEPDPDSALASWLHERAARPFDLSRRLDDCALIRMAPDRWVWFLNQHHLVTDGWSAALAYRTISEFYTRSRAGTLGDAPPLPRFADYVAHEREFRNSPIHARVQKYWNEKLEQPIEPIRMYGRRSEAKGTRTERVTRDLGQHRSAALRALASRYPAGMFAGHLPAFNVFATALFAWLHRVSGQSRLAIGTPSHNRPTAAFKNTPGLFIEVFPFIADVEPDASFESLLECVRSETAAFLRHAQPGTSSAAVNRSYNVLLNYIHAEFPTFAGMPMRSEWIHPGHGDAAHHLRLQVHDFDAAGRFILHFDFHCDVFTVQQREDAADQFISVLDAFLADPSSRIAAAPLMSRDAALRWLDRVTPAPAPVPESTVLRMFADQADRTPDAIAVTEGESALTYRALRYQAIALADTLSNHAADESPFVGLHAGNGIDAVVGILAAMYAGRAWVPLPPADPVARLRAILRDAGIRTVLAGAKSVDSARTRLAAGADVRVLDVSRAQDAVDPATPPEPTPRDAAYALYTSGSTGTPKGVIIEHRSLANYVAWARDTYAGKRPVNLPLFTSLAFDLTITSIFLPLVTGGRIRIYPEDDAMPAVFRVFEDDAVDIVKLTPSHISLLRGRSFPGKRIRTLIVGGEELRRDQAEAARSAIGNDIAIYNEYGPTEATVGCMVHRYDPADASPAVPIGKAAANARIVVRDEGNNVVPAGVSGEICIGGPGLARGYLARPALTAERFVADALTGERFYRTGDIGRWRSDGTLEYLGRSDEQIKIRGVRMEPGEIEAALMAVPEVRAAAVAISTARNAEPRASRTCKECGLAANVPGADIDADGVCVLCRRFAGYRANAQRYFRTMAELEREIEQARADSRGDYDCLMLLSGGKDSTYALARLVDLGARVFAFTLDNGYISDSAKHNIRRVTDKLGVPHVFATTPAMNAIFLDSLERHSNVCNGCFKTVYTLGARFARQKGIPFVVTGLSRGQFFETRLTEELFLDDAFDPARIDAVILEARKAYHRTDDAVARLLDTRDFRDDALFEDVRFVDFYRYCDVPLDEMLAYLAERVPWVRPADTGRSTNCLINQAGIFVHLRERGYHNYAFPYSWDVRMGHKQRDAALAELDDELDPAEIRRMLAEIGYHGPASGDDAARLVAWYVADSEIPASRFREHLSRILPDAMVPSDFMRLDALPLARSGKIDRSALPEATVRTAPDPTFVAPRSPVEDRIATIWCDVLHLERAGIQDRFLDLGGNSLLAIQVISRVNQAFDIDLPLRSAFEAATIERLGRLVEDTLVAEIETLSDDEAERLTVGDR